MSIAFPIVAVLLALNAAALVTLVLLQKGRGLRSIFGTGQDVLGPRRAPTILFWMTSGAFGSMLALTFVLHLLAH